MLCPGGKIKDPIQGTFKDLLFFLGFPAQENGLQETRLTKL